MFIRFTLKMLILAMSLILFGCASDKLVKTYEGEVLSKELAAVLTAPENITLLSVNGVAVQQYLLSNLEVNYALKPGQNLVVFKYKSIWSKAKRDQETGSRVEVVETEPLEVQILAKPGAKYAFSFLPADKLKDAQALASNFVAQIVDENNVLVAESVALNTHQKEKEQALLAEHQADKLDSANIEEMTVINQLKAIWPRASADEKKAFLVWVFQK